MLYGLGALAAGIFITNIFKFLNKNSEMKLFALSFFTLILLFFNKTIYGLFILYFIFGLSNTALKVYMNTLFMKIIPEEIYGKCYSIINSISSIIQIFILMILGYILDIYGAAIGYVILAIIMLLDAFLFKYKYQK